MVERARQAVRLFYHGCAMERIMSSISSSPAPQGITSQSLMGGVVASLKCWWVACRTWRIEQVAIDRICSMSDHALKDIGLTRSGIPDAVKDERAIDRTFTRYY
jgi:uncharacterized protein YjiS (DUF1127 family)